jgi:release factor glutamine methyltransferase
MEALQWANHKLKQHRDVESEGGAWLDSPMLDAEVLLAGTLSVQKSWLFTHFDQELRDHEMEKFQRMVERRIRHEPIAYIVGKKEFFKRTFHVNRFVLIPRPATETLATEAIAVAKGTAPEAVLFADVGTGSGAIAVTLASETRIPVIATDVSREALTVARHNAREHEVEDLVDFRHGDLLEPLGKIFSSLKRTEGHGITHLVVCANLPYLTTTQWETSQEEVRDFEPKLALDAGTDGLDAYWKLFRELKRHRHLFPKLITVLIEIDPAQTSRVRALIRHDFPEAQPRVIKDLDSLDRVVVTEL